MYTLSNLIIISAILALSGLGIGYLLGRKLGPDNVKQREMERNLDELLQKQRDYQHDVKEHFTDTGKLLHTLAESYRDVHNHLANGASQLCNDQSASILPPIPDGSLLTLTEAPALESVQAPLDYAPKTSPFETGMLNEEFGLDKKAAAAQPAPEIVPDAVIPVVEPTIAPEDADSTTSKV